MPSDMGRRERERRAEEVFVQLLEMPAQARVQHLEAACSDDPQLRLEVETMLRVSPEARAWFEALMKEELSEALTRFETNYADAGASTLEESPVPVSEASVLAHYRIDRRLGVGGMGEVYAAWDVALGRPAAVKVLRPDLGDDLRRRLVQECEVLSRLEHPAIATYFESGESGGHQYLAMELVEGETLRSRLRRGALPAGEAFAIVAALLEALTHAHANGILHRDIKPENIILTPNGSAKLLDFGIAKAMQPLAGRGDDETRTVPTARDSILGTLGYMAPEQLRGEATSASADVFAMGAVLYEMLSGERAFPGRTNADKIAAILSRDVPSIEMYTVPAACNSILKRALVRDVNERYASASEFLADLRRLSAEQTSQCLPNTLAILDFTNLGPSAADDWLGSGLAESLGADIGRVEGLELVPRVKVLQARAGFANGETTAVAMGLAIGCRWVLTGSFRRTGDDLELTAQLVEVAPGEQLWTETLRGSLNDVFAMRDRLAKLTAENLHVMMPRRATQADERLDVFEHYSRAERLRYRVERGTLEQARQTYERVIELDPKHAPALAGIAFFYAPGRWLVTTDPKDLELAALYGQRAIEIDSTLFEARAWLGYVLWRQGRIPEALETLAAAMRDGRNPIAPYVYACSLLESGRPREALSMAQRAVALDPRATWVFGALGIAHMELDQLAEARWSLERGWKLEQEGGSMGFVGVGSLLAECLRRSGLLLDARIQCLKSLDVIERSDHPLRDSVRATCLCIVGRIALDEGNLVAAQVAYRQAMLHVRGRPSGCGIGHTVVQALAGQSRAGAGTGAFVEARRIFEERSAYDFSYAGLASNALTLVDLALAARDLGSSSEASEFLRRAHELHSAEARRVEKCHGRS